MIFNYLVFKHTKCIVQKISRENVNELQITIDLMQRDP